MRRGGGEPSNADARRAGSPWPGAPPLPSHPRPTRPAAVYGGGRRIRRGASGARPVTEARPRTGVALAILAHVNASRCALAIAVDGVVGELP
jgi:hypothetical protein